MKLPSQHQMGDKVYFELINEDIKNGDSIIESSSYIQAKVKAIHFYKSKVKYDLELCIKYPTRIYNVDSINVIKINLVV